MVRCSWCGLASLLVLGCGGGGGSGSGGKDGSTVATTNGASNGSGGSSATTTTGGGGSGASWSDLPAGDGQRAADFQARCVAQCENDGACGFWDPGECQRRCNDPRRLCQADLTADACWELIVAFETCQGTLNCSELNHFYYDASTSDRPCRAEAEAMEAECGYRETIAASECVGTTFDCADGSDSVSGYWVCDGENDCADASDEADCPWLTNGVEARCIDSATIDGEDPEGDIAALAGVTCIDGPLYVRNSTLSDLQGLESLSAVSELYIGGTPPLSFDPEGNPNLVSLAGLEGLRGVTYVTIEGNPELVDLSALSGLTFVTSRLRIAENEKLATLEGLHQIDSVGDLEIEGNPALADLQGLRGLTRVDGLDFALNPLVVDFSGLEGIQYIGATGASISSNEGLVDFAGLDSVASIGNSFYVSRNSSLTSFSGLGGLTRLAWTLTVSNNDLLTSITEMTNVEEIRGEVTISGNPMLPTCNIDALLEPLSVTCACSENDDLATCE